MNRGVCFGLVMVLAMLCPLVSVRAQVTEIPTKMGSISIGGAFSGNVSANFSRIGTNAASTNASTSEFNFNINLGFFTAPYLSIGPMLYYSSFSTVQGNRTFTNGAIGGGAFIRPYIYVLPQLPLIFHTEGLIGAGNASSLQLVQYRVGTGLGMAYFFTKNVSAELLFMYRYTSSSYDAGANTTVTDFSHSFQPSAGFLFYF